MNFCTTNRLWAGSVGQQAIYLLKCLWSHIWEILGSLKTKPGSAFSANLTWIKKYISVVPVTIEDRGFD
jgi:hypothetical protein